MPAKSFIGEIENAARHFYATTMRGEVSDANVRGYLRAASQIEEVWQQADDKVAALSASGAAPWDAYHQMRYPLAFIRAARSYQLFVRELSLRARQRLAGMRGMSASSMQSGAILAAIARAVADATTAPAHHDVVHRGAV